MDINNINEIIERKFPDYDEEIIIYDNPSYADAFIGISLDGRAVYDYNKMVAWLITHDNMTEEEAIEFIDYNTLGAHFSDKDPIVINTIDF